MRESIDNIFKKIPKERRTFKINQGNLDFAILKILMLMKDEMGCKKLTAQQISDIIDEVYDYCPISAKRVSNILRKFENNEVKVYTDSKPQAYEIKQSGKEYINEHNGIELIILGPKKEHKALKALSELFPKLEGTVKICDPYCNEKTSYSLSDIKNETKLILSFDQLKNNREKNKAKNAFKMIMKDCQTFKVRDMPGGTIHDRFILSDNFLIILGSSINHLGDKPSFMLVFNRTEFNDIYQTVLQLFDSLWSRGSPF